MPKPILVVDLKEDGWPCACVKRNRKGQMTHIKLNHPSLKRCSRCKCTKEDSDRACREMGMGWSIGFDSRWNRDIGYGVPAYCDHPKCWAEIDRGLAYVCCGQEAYGGDGCGLYFCDKHLGEKCARCRNRKPPYPAKPDHPRWIRHKLTDASWQQWRDENPSEVAALTSLLAD